jgi:PEP-CTERM motif
MREKKKQTSSSNWFPAAVAGCSMLVAVSGAWANTVTVGALQDAMIFGTSAGADTGNASGEGPALFAGADGGGGIKRSELEFNIASANIPAGATITGVTMTLFLAQVAGSGGGGGSGSGLNSRVLSLYDMNQPWGEGTSGSPTSPSVGGTGQGFPRVNGDSTWDYAFYNSNPALAIKWNSNDMGLPGDTSPTTDLHGGNFSSTASGTSIFTSFSTLNAPFTWSSAGMAADVQAWVDGTEPNNGWLLKSDNLEGTPTSFLGFWSTEGAAANNNSAIAPELTITFSVPEPASLMLITLGLPILTGRRRSRAHTR